MPLVSSADFTLQSWQDVAIFVGIVTAFSTLIGGLGATVFNRRKSLIDKKASDDAASDRIIVLVEKEAEKRVEVVRTEFALKIAEMELKHHSELTKVRTDFEAQLALLREEKDKFHCQHALTCVWRYRQSPPPSP